MKAICLIRLGTSLNVTLAFVHLQDYFYERSVQPLAPAPLAVEKDA
jgi:hypothetical protein